MGRRIAVAALGGVSRGRGAGARQRLSPLSPIGGEGQGEGVDDAVRRPFTTPSPLALARSLPLPRWGRGVV
jgi:hypothetical protein